MRSGRTSPHATRGRRRSPNSTSPLSASPSTVMATTALSGSSSANTAGLRMSANPRPVAACTTAAASATTARRTRRASRDAHVGRAALGGAVDRAPSRARQLALEDLAGGVARQLVEELDLARDLVAARLALTWSLSSSTSTSRPRETTTKAFRRWPNCSSVDADDGHLVDGLVVGEQVLDLAREHVLAARDDHLVVAAVDEQAPAGVEVPDVARGQQAADVLPCCRRRCSPRRPSRCRRRSARSRRRRPRCPPRRGA